LFRKYSIVARGIAFSGNIDNYTITFNFLQLHNIVDYALALTQLVGILFYLMKDSVGIGSDSNIFNS
jgi:hypothetical protein